MQRGDVFTVDPAAANEADLLGYTHVDAVFAARDLLPAIGDGFGAQGFSAPLPAGDYTFWIMELASGSFPYRFDFVVSATAAGEARQVPALEPAALALLCLGLTSMGARRLRQHAG